MVLPAIIPVVVGLYSLFDLGVYATSGKDVIEHVTGVDVIGSIFEWAFPSEAPVPSQPDLAAEAMVNMSSMATISILVILIVCAAAMLLKRRA